MKVIPIAFAFDSRLDMPACICIYSLLANANTDTFYDIYILRPQSDKTEVEGLGRLQVAFHNHHILYRTVDNCFKSAFEIRGITNVTYFRLLIPELIPECDKIIYSDVDVIFRSDLSQIYENTDMTAYYIAGVNSLSHLHHDRNRYYRDKIKIDPKGVVYAGNIIINSAKIRKEHLVKRFVEHVWNNYQFQDLDVLNIVCKGAIKQLPPAFCVTTDVSELKIYNRKALLEIWSEEELQQVIRYGTVHYNGIKPWAGVCINSDIWWEYYRKSPFFDEKFYFDFFNIALNQLDLLPLWKRVKILARYFVYGKRNASVFQ